MKPLIVHRTEKGWYGEEVVYKRSGSGFYRETTNIAIPQATLWWRKARVNVTWLFILSFIINIGMWFERFVIVVTSLYRDYLPSSWGTFRATKWDYMLFIGTWGLFTTLFLLFVRFLPIIPMSEIRMMLPQTKITRGGPTADTVSEEMT